jgi:hypothetical protein
MDQQFVDAGKGLPVHGNNDIAPFEVLALSHACHRRGYDHQLRRTRGRLEGQTEGGIGRPLLGREADDVIGQGAAHRDRGQLAGNADGDDAFRWLPAHVPDETVQAEAIEEMARSDQNDSLPALDPLRSDGSARHVRLPVDLGLAKVFEHSLQNRGFERLRHFRGFKTFSQKDTALRLRRIRFRHDGFGFFRQDLPILDLELGDDFPRRI